MASNSVLVSAMMKQLDANADGKIEKDENKLTKEDLNRLHLNANTFSTKSLEFLGESMDDLENERQKKWRIIIERTIGWNNKRTRGYKRGKRRTPREEKSRLAY